MAEPTQHHNETADETKELQLVRLAQNGDKAAQERLISNYLGLIKAKARAYYLIGADSDDIIQEGMIGLYKAVRDFQEEKQSSFRTFAELCITRQILTAIKTATRQKHKPLNSYISLNKTADDEDIASPSSAMEIGSTADNPEAMLIGREEVEQLEGRLGRVLSPLEREVFGQYIAGKSYADIAAALHKPMKSVDNAIQRIRRKLMRSMT